MKNTVAKLYLSVEINNVEDDIVWNVETPYNSVFNDNENNIFVFEFDHDYKKCSNIKLNILNKNHNDSHLKIKEVKIDDKVLNSINNWCVIVDNHGNRINDTHGWFSVVGSCTLKIRYSPITQNYLNYFLDISK